MYNIQFFFMTGLYGLGYEYTQHDIPASAHLDVNRTGIKWKSENMEICPNSQIWQEQKSTTIMH